MIKDADIDAFVKLVDSRPLGIGNSDLSEPLEAITERIHSTICVPNGRSAADMRALHRALLRRSRVGLIDDKYADVLRPLFYFSSNALQYKSFDDHAEWSAALTDLKKYVGTPGCLYDGKSMLGFDRDLAVIHAIKRLQARGYRFEGVDESIHFAGDDEMLRCADDLFDKFKTIDGFRVVACLLKAIQQNNQFVRDRYLIGRTSSAPWQGPSGPSLPFGYLLNLAFANMGSERPGGDPVAQAQDMFEMATDIVAVMDLETYYTFAYTSTVHDRLPRYIQELLVGDHALTFRQIAPDDGLTIIRGVFSWVDDDKMLAALGWGVNHAIALAEWTFLQINARCINGTLSRQAFSESGIEESILDRLLSDLTHDSAVVNSAYRTPLDATKADALFKPLFLCPDGRYLIPAPSISSIGFYEAIASGVRAAHGTQTDQKIGDAIESTLAGAFQRNGITPSVVSRKYDMFGTQGECDLVIETASTILLIELKKKSMTRASQAGDSFKSFADLFGGVLDTQSQLGQHELLLLEHGHIEFLDGSRLERAERSIERLAVTLMDWGGTQDRMVLRTVANTLMGSSVALDGASASQAELLSKANNTLAELARQQNQLEPYYKEIRNWQFSNWWFLSVPQILYVLGEANSAEQFYERLRKVKSATSGSLDFYKEYELFHTLAEKAAKGAGEPLPMK
ncbi:hypothetical protein PQR36_29015 [Paraburkholderia nemoris]|uniref:hypothetical protein n=1 Tax=Paraburkholderia nemoris TaxID=2793076 RepID=UPI0038BD7D6A